ncbi:MAG: bis(5'-nucleosyl)-tetraphosphatase (symmetrical) YqeK [Clostridiales bacterium]|nr:bis(5'-nucleosyl)-tetraphosphatase (symmetrical) YqeK [Clostridiales bacterium]
MKYDLRKMEKKLAKYLDEDRYVHTLGVMYTCTALAMAYGCDLEAAQAAGLLHDCAKCIPNKKKLKMCAQHKIPVTEFEEQHPFLLHAKLGAYIARHKYDITDEEILSAIACHTTGKPHMTLLEKIVYIADYIEPGRDKAPDLPFVRKLAFSDLDECMYEILKDTLAYLEENPKELDHTTTEAYIYYKDLHLRRGQNAQGLPGSIHQPE